MRTCIIGDVHGCVDEFRQLYELFDPKPGDRVIQVGDLMDRGPDPVGCVRFAISMGIEVTASNHDDKHARWRKHRANNPGKKNPVNLKEKDIEDNLQLSDQEIQWMASAPLMIRALSNVVVVHAGLEPAYSLSQQGTHVKIVRYVDSKGKFVGYRGGNIFEQPEGTRAWSEVWNGPESVVYGHHIHSFETPRMDRFDGGFCLGIDTGCVYGGRLTAAVFEDGCQEPEFLQVSPSKVHYEAFPVKP